MSHAIANFICPSLKSIRLRLCKRYGWEPITPKKFESTWNVSWVSLKTFWKWYYKETKRKRKISEKKRISQERFFPEKILFSKKKFSFHNFFSKYSWRRKIKHENGSIGCVRTIRIVQKSRKSIRSGQKVKKRIFSGKNLFWKNSLFFWKFSLSRDFSLFL